MKEKNPKKAYDIEDYHSARTVLINIMNELERINHSAAKSLKEGMEKTLTLHRSGFTAMGRSFKTTNIIENVNRLIIKHVGKVRNWKNSNMKMRWMAAALLEVEKKLRKVDHYDRLDLLRTAVKTELKLKKEMVA